MPFSGHRGGYRGYHGGYHGSKRRSTRLRLSKYSRNRGIILSIILIFTVSLLPSGVRSVSGAPDASRKPTGTGSASIGAPLVTGADYTLKSAMFKSDTQDAREQSLKDNLTIPPGATDATFISDPTRAPIDFTDVAPHWWADAPDGTSIQVELRTSADGKAWADWQSADAEDVIMASDSITETYSGLITVDQTVRTHRYVQSRITLHRDARGQGPGAGAQKQPASPDPQSLIPGPSPATPTFHELTYTFINGGVTPNSPRPQIMIQGTPSDVPKPPLVSRLDWGSPQGTSSPKWTPTYRRVTHIIIHHTATSNADTDYAARVRAIWFYHANTRGWGDIGYNYVIDPNGVVYEGRAGGDDVEAGHAYPFNNGTMGIGMLGDFMKVAPTDVAISSLVSLISWKASQRGIDPHATLPITGITDCGDKITYDRPTIAGHRDYKGKDCGRAFNSSTCPGDRLEAMLPQIRDAVVTQQPPLRATFGEHDTPGNIEPGATLDVHLTVHNTGAQTWEAAGQGAVVMGYRWFTPDNVPLKDGWQDVKTVLPRNVSFADTLTMTAKLNAPTLPGHYALIWDLYEDGQGWFADAGSQPLRVDVVVGKDLTDKTAPSSQVLPLPVYSNDPQLPIRWAGNDDPKGAGIASYDIQYRLAPNGSWTDWKNATSDTQATFEGQDGATYEFRSRARDAAGNLEEWPQQPDTYTTVDTRPPLLIIDAPAADDHVAPGKLIVRGRTDPGAFVAVNNTRAEEAAGVFTATLDAEGRDFTIHVTAADPAANISRLELVVQAAPRYGDVLMDHPAFVAIEYLSGRNIISGYPDGSFKPGAYMTRAQLAKTLATAMRWGLIKPLESRFTDVSTDSWMFPYVETVAARGAMSPFPDGTFAPNQNVTRHEAMSAILSAASTVPNARALIFADLPPNHWVNTCLYTSDEKSKARIDDGSVSYCGSLSITRADVSLIVYGLRRALEADLQNPTRDDNGQ